MKSLKKSVPTDMVNFFMIVTKSALTVHKREEVNSKVVGTLATTDVVRITKKKRNWTRISYQNPNSGKVLEGWVLTRYLKKIN